MILCNFEITCFWKFVHLQYYLSRSLCGDFQDSYGPILLLTTSGKLLFFAGILSFQLSFQNVWYVVVHGALLVLKKNFQSNCIILPF